MCELKILNKWHCTENIRFVLFWPFSSSPQILISCEGPSSKFRLIQISNTVAYYHRYFTYIISTFIVFACISWFVSPIGCLAEIIWRLIIVALIHKAISYDRFNVGVIYVRTCVKYTTSSAAEFDKYNILTIYFFVHLFPKFQITMILEQ